MVRAAAAAEQLQMMEIQMEDSAEGSSSSPIAGTGKVYARAEGVIDQLVYLQAYLTVNMNYCCLLSFILVLDGTIIPPIPLSRAPSYYSAFHCLPRLPYN